MDKKLKNTAIAVAFVFSAAACTHEPAKLIAPDVFNNIRFLSDAELKDIEGIFSKNGTKRYDYRIVRIQTQKVKGRKLIETRKSDLHGLIIMRSKKHLNPFGGDFYNDGQGNLLYFGGSKAKFSMTYMANGKNILAIDTNHDGFVDTVFGNIDADNFWILSEHLRDLLPCLSASGDDVYGAVLNCAKPGNSGDAGSGSSEGGTDFANFGPDLLGEPDCRPTTPGSIAAGGGPETPPGEDPAPPPPPPSSMSPDDEDYPPMGRQEKYTTEEDGRQMRVVTVRTSESTVEQVTGTASDGSVIRTTIVRDAQGRETYREDILVGPGPDRRLLMHSVNRTSYDSDGNPHSEVTVSRQARTGRSLPPINPDGSTVFEDPRCAGRDTHISQGLGFFDLCAQQRSIDFLSCYKQLESPLFNISGGRCTLVPGPAGGKVLNCSSGKSIFDCIAAGGSPAECARNGSDTNDIAGPGGPDAGPADGPRLPGTQQVETRYIDTIPLGAVLMGICSSGGCPDPRPF